ncbi:MAG: DNA repair protein RecO [Alphaproteobacteria bacterium]|nr:DNA repair protein RecO [Alphaproteobacteria bacterium]
MEWSDEAIVLGTRRHGENSTIVELLTLDHGRHLGLCRGSGLRIRPLVQPGNSVRALWRARLDEHLGTWALEGVRARAAELLASAHGTYGVTHLCALARLLPEREPCPDLFLQLVAALDDFAAIATAALHIVRFELALLSELGFGLDLESCAVTGERRDLIYVSPKSGRAVSRQAGEPWRALLLPLPPFLRLAGDHPACCSDQDLRDGFQLTGRFLKRHVLEPRGLGHNEAREGFLNALSRHQGRQARPLKGQDPS